MKCLQEYLKESILDADFDEIQSDNTCASIFEEEFLVKNKRVGKYAEFEVKKNVIDINIGQCDMIARNAGICFTQELSDLCKKCGIDTVNVKGAGEFDLIGMKLEIENAQDLTFNIHPYRVRLGMANMIGRSSVKNCTINCEHIQIESNMPHHEAPNTKINAKIAEIDPDVEWASCTVNAKVILVPYVEFTPDDLKRRCGCPYDFENDFDYNNLKPLKKTSWSPGNMFGKPKVNPKTIVFHRSASDSMWRNNGLDVDPDRNGYYIVMFNKGGSGEFGGYELKFDRISDNTNSAINAYIKNNIL